MSSDTANLKMDDIIRNRAQVIALHQYGNDLDKLSDRERDLSIALAKVIIGKDAQIGMRLMPENVAEAMRIMTAYIGGPKSADFTDTEKFPDDGCIDLPPTKMRFGDYRIITHALTQAENLQ